MGLFKVTVQEHQLLTLTIRYDNKNSLRNIWNSIYFLKIMYLFISQLSSYIRSLHQNRSISIINIPVQFLTLKKLWHLINTRLIWLRSFFSLTRCTYWRVTHFNIWSLLLLITSILICASANIYYLVPWIASWQTTSISLHYKAACI